MVSIENFQNLEEYSLVQWKNYQQGYAMHKLVQAWGHDKLTADDQRKFRVATFQLIMAAIDGCRNAPEEKLQLVPHIMTSFATRVNPYTSKQVADRPLDERLQGLVLS
jgi:hypothetical protein